MAYGTVTLGRLALREALTKTTEGTSNSRRVYTVSGQESAPVGMTVAQIAAVQDDILNLPDRLVSVTFTDKQDRNGYYTVTDSSADLMNWNDELISCDWKISLVREGSDTEADIESRLSGALTRNTNFAVTGTRWQSPPIGHYAYWSGTTQPSVLTRTGSDGSHVVYLGVPVLTNPRYGCPVSSYFTGRVMFKDSSGFERTGTNFTVAGSGWELSNGLVKVQLLAGVPAVLNVSAYTGGAFQGKGWDLLTGGTSLGVPTTTTVLRNDPETVVLRLLWTQATPGRVTADLTLRRGSRLVELYIQAEYSTTIRIARQVTEAGTSATGYVRATANDAAGNRYAVGSALTFTADTTNGAISKASATTLDAFISVIAAGSGAVTGDQGDDLMKQYLGAPSETVRAVRR